MKFLKFIAAAVFALAMVACGDEPTNTPVEKSPFRMEVSSNFVQIGVDHAYFLVYLDEELVDPAELTFYDENDEEVEMTTLEIEIDGQTVTVPEWAPTEPTTKSFWVSYKTYFTKELITITAVDFAFPDSMEDPQPDNVSFKKRTFFTQFTGAGCGYCPWAKAALYEAAADEAYADKFVVAAIYTYDGQTSKLYPTENGDISTAFGVSSYPTVIYDMIGSFSYERVDKDYVSVKAAIDNTQQQEAKAGIAVNVASDEGDTFVARVSVKAAVDGEYNVGAWLVEDGIKEKQANNGCGYPMDFDNHNNVLRYADSGKEYIGHSLGAMKAGEIKDHVFTMNFFKGTYNKDGKEVKAPWVKENCRLIVFVTTSVRGSAYVTNVVANDIYSESIAFDYK